MEILAINCGSSTVKYARFEVDAGRETELARGTVEVVADHGAAVRAMLAQLPRPPDAVGHRLVHGGPTHAQPLRLDDAARAELAQLVSLAPLHLPSELAAIDAVRAELPATPQVACFDTAFHRTMPEVARRYALPSSLAAAGVERYGFHGLSYEYVASMLGPAQRSRAIIAHLGNGASLVAIRDGKSIDTTMGFSPSGGIVMGTRAGDVDPGLVLYLLAQSHDAAGLEQLFDREAGLLAVSGMTADMRALLAARDRDRRAALAIDMFCYSARKAIGAFTAILGGVETLVFTGGIGEHAAPVRAQICEGLAHLGIATDPVRNAAHAPTIGAGQCDVRVIATNEELVITRATARLLAG
jgi:acetate kinase